MHARIVAVPLAPPLAALAGCEPPLVCREPDVWVTGAFASPDICVLDADAMADEIDANVPYALTIE